ncbi:helix-turn-helix domain-containing protein [Pseudonocardia sp. HH130630-07]|uniref:helix-turn-helix domain-containing protein n=1 Tax=Pseudonocardia sp. HH130630-07 TaxID=1690815 RepID=UPI0008152532|nr:helix-turn-helix transcriptional regulator [Pseudonocardia sp. HH130630-07]ANY08776.1 hypothetical protein AFB00_23720 [Pseudonocardia sp. HH130630-07]
MAGTGDVGTRIVELRTWRGMDARVVADLAGISASYLSLIENGKRSVNRRETLEAIARALRVHPAELAAVPVSGAEDPDVARARTSLNDVETALTEAAVGERTVTPRPWTAVAADLHRLRTDLKPNADLPGQMAVYPGLWREVNAHAAEAPTSGLLADIVWLALDISNSAGAIGANSVAALAVSHMREAAAGLDDPLWSGVAAYGRALGLGAGGSRSRALQVTGAALDALDPAAGDAHRQVAGALHLSSALSTSTLGDTDRSRDHLAEAARLSGDDDASGTGFAGLAFSRANVAIWSAALAVEEGDHGRALELGRDPVAATHPSRSRRGALHADLARALAGDRRRRPEAVRELLTAERLAPVRTRANVWARSVAGELLRGVRRDSADDRELRGFAYRAGLVPA